MAQLEKIARTVSELIQPKVKPRDLIKAVRKRHPKASKGDITRAAFYAMILAAEQGKQEEAVDLQTVALDTRVAEEIHR